MKGPFREAYQGPWLLFQEKWVSQVSAMQVLSCLLLQNNAR